MPITTNYNRGAVVLIPFVFSDQTSSKVRPAVVISPHFPSEDLLVVGITSVGDRLLPGEFAIQFWREAGLIHPSFTKCAIASVSTNLVRRQLGQLQINDLEKLTVSVRCWLGL